MDTYLDNYKSAVGPLMGARELGLLNRAEVRVTNLWLLTSGLLGPVRVLQVSTAAPAAAKAGRP